jgi:hypothetical protein
MARYKYIDTNPRFLAIDLAKQLRPGTFEHAVITCLSGRSICRTSMRASRVTRPARARIADPRRDGD